MYKNMKKMWRISSLRSLKVETCEKWEDEILTTVEAVTLLEKSLPSENELSPTLVTITTAILQVLGNVINPR